MLGGELLFHFMNVMLLTLVVAPLVLWRYRRAVLAGMQHRLGAPLPVPAPCVAAPRAPAFTVAGALAWEAHLRRRRRASHASAAATLNAGADRAAVAACIDRSDGRGAGTGNGAPRRSCMPASTARR